MKSVTALHVRATEKEHTHKKYYDENNNYLGYAMRNANPIGGRSIVFTTLHPDIYYFNSKSYQEVSMILLKQLKKEPLTLYQHFGIIKKINRQGIIKKINRQEIIPMNYQDFLFAMLFMGYVNTNKTEYQDMLEYDLIFPEVLKHQELFLESEYNIDSKSEYDCINNYLYYRIY